MPYVPIIQERCRGLQQSKLKGWQKYFPAGCTFQESVQQYGSHTQNIQSDITYSVFLELFISQETVPFEGAFLLPNQMKWDNASKCSLSWTRHADMLEVYNMMRLLLLSLAKEKIPHITYFYSQIINNL